MTVKTAILATQPTSYWPLDDAAGTSCHDEIGLHDAVRPEDARDVDARARAEAEMNGRAVQRLLLGE